MQGNLKSEVETPVDIVDGMKKSRLCEVRISGSDPVFRRLDRIVQLVRREELRVFLADIRDLPTRQRV